MTTASDIAREGLELRAKATPGEWLYWYELSAMKTSVHTPMQVEICETCYPEARFIAHAGTHYATIAQALLAAEAREKALREALDEMVKASSWARFVERKDSDRLQKARGRASDLLDAALTAAESRST